MKDEKRTKKELIEELKKLRKEKASLRKSGGGSDLYSNLFHNSNDGIFIHDLEGSIIDVNQKVLDQLGYSKDELLSLNIADLHPAASHELSKSAFKTIYRDGSVNLVIDFVRKDGGTFPAEVSSSLFSADGEVMVQGFVRDISERMEIEERLRGSEVMLRGYFDRSPTGIVIYPVQERPLGKGLQSANFNPAFQKFLGYTREEISGMSIEDISHPADMEKNINLSNELLAGKRDGYQMEKRYIRKDGETFWGLLNVTTLRDPYGKISHIMSTLVDITKRKKAEHDLISERNFSKAIINSLPDMFYCFDDNGRFLLWNKNLEKASGYSAKEISERKVLDFFSGKDKKAIYETLKEVFEKGRSTVEANLIHKDKSKAPYFFTGVRTEIDGKLYLLGTGMDISGRKQMEEELHSLSLSDELTGLYNRRGFMTLAEQELRIARRMKRGMILIYADLDDLKTINDGFGHEAGDRMIQETALFLKDIFRESDIIARIGGDEFVVFSIQTTDTSVETIRSRFEESLEEFNKKRKSTYRLSMSIGIVHYREDCPDSIEELLKQADVLMYEHKKSKHKRMKNA